MKLAIFTVAILFAGVGVQAQILNTLTKTVASTAEVLQDASNCVIGLSQFAYACDVGDLTSPVWNLLGQTLSANAVCEVDCRCTHGAQGGGSCVRNTAANNKMFCRCEYAVPSAPTVIDTALCPLTQVYQKVLCSTSLYNDVVCNSDCVCSHGYSNSSSTTNHCQTAVNGNKYCQCGGGVNAF